MYRKLLYLLLIAALPNLTLAANKQSAAEACLQHITLKQYEDVVLACTDTFGQSWEMAVVSQTYFSHLGTFDALTVSGELLLKHAETGDAVAQYLFGLIQFTLAPQPSDRVKWGTEIKRRSMAWFAMAAKQGHQPAMIAYIERALMGMELPSATEHENASRYAAYLYDNIGEPARPFVLAMNSIPHQENWQTFINQKVANPSELSTTELKDLARGLAYGRIEFESGIEGMGKPGVRFPPLDERRLTVLKYLDEERYDGAASFELANANRANLELYKQYLGRAIARKHPAALRFFGLYLACHSQKSAATKYLLQAKVLGDTNASDDLLELEEYGDVYNCPSIQLGQDFITQYL